MAENAALIDKRWVIAVHEHGRWAIAATYPAATPQAEVEAAAQRLARQRHLVAVLLFGPPSAIAAHCDRVNVRPFQA